MACKLQRINPLLIKMGSMAVTLLVIVAVAVSFLFAKSDAEIASQEQDSALRGSTAVLELSPGSSGSEVVHLQTSLLQLGYYSTGVNGSYGTLTYSAVENFQKNNDLPVTGVADLATMELLYSGEADKAEIQRQPFTSLKYGDQSADVIRLQQLLKCFGYFTENCEGSFGTATRNAVKGYQQQNDLPATGVANDATLTLLFTQAENIPSYAEVNDQSSAEAVKTLQQGLADMQLMAADYCTGTLGDITRGAIKALQKNFGLPQTGVADNQTQQMLFTAIDASGVAGTAQPKYATLQKEAQGEGVKTLQKALKRIGYLSADATGYYGDLTVTAVSAFQKYVGTKATGVADSRTQDRIYTLAQKMPDNNKTYATLSLEDNQGYVKRLQEGLKKLGYFSGSTTSYFGDKTADAVRAFQKAKGLPVTGKADSATQKLLFSLAPEAEKLQLIEKVNWFNEGNNLIKKGVVFKVIDVATGKSFNVIRKGGIWHADSEPATKQDTAAFKSIVGSWSWNRRAVVLVYNGRYIAASINAMPHSPDFISNNNFPGHFCIHLVGSKIHASGKVDPDHQAMIQRAYSQGYKVI